MQKFLKEMALELLQDAVLYIKWHPSKDRTIDQVVIHTLNQKTLEVIKDASS